MARFDDYFGGAHRRRRLAKIPAKAFAVVIRSSAAATAALGNDEIQWQQKIESDAYNTSRTTRTSRSPSIRTTATTTSASTSAKGHIYADKAPA